MQRLMQTIFGGGAVAAILLAAAFFISLGSIPTRMAQADPPANQAYTGSKKCSACHFEQYMAWRKTGHAKAFDLLTAKYEKDEKCLKCHTTGYGEATGFKDAASTAALAGITCETCHGPGSEHEKISLPFAKVKELTPEQEASIRGSIWKLLPKNVCVECHSMQAHKPTETPKELQKK